jgi:hypothetical protein
MANPVPTIGTIQNKTKQTMRQAAPWVERLARAGYAAKGAVYIIIGVLAVMAAFTGQGKTTDSAGALVSVAHNPLGRFLLILVAVGLAGYALWRFIEAGLDPEHEGNDTKGLATRIGFILSGIVYSTLSYTAFTLFFGTAEQNQGENGMQDGTARVLAMPFGQGLVGIGGLIVIGLGIGQIIRGYKTEFQKQLNLSEMPAKAQQWAIMGGRIGHIARGIVFMIVGGFFINAAWYNAPQKAKGLGSALDLLAQQSYGTLVLGIVAAGLVLYGAFMFVEARYRRITL